ncbi:CGNR zinc finger domain-containing protein [Micromonospora sp. NPDC049891]|uniref:CGNR zinc finger domain-containing protein n=1 Tax=Micromonospora sp. NPDC049891 TaxID=3155655 RepID=UPI0033D807CB
MSTGRTVPATAPGRLHLVQRFLNSLHVERGTDALDEPVLAYTWMVEAGLTPPPAPGPVELDRLRTLRRELRARCGDGSPDDEALARLALDVPLVVLPGVTGALHLAPGRDDHSAALAILLAAAYEAQSDGTWSRLKTCHHGGCRWVFYDESRSRTATWCAMGVCGNRTKVAAYRRRRQSA